MMQMMPKLKRAREEKRGNKNQGLAPMPKLPNLNPELEPADARPEWRMNKAGDIVGNCKRCGKETRAMGLVPTPDRMVFGEMKEGGWHCSECKPREFGRINGQPPLALRGL